MEEGSRAHSNFIPLLGCIGHQHLLVMTAARREIMDPQLFCCSLKGFFSTKVSNAVSSFEYQMPTFTGLTCFYQPPMGFIQNHT